MSCKECRHWERSTFKDNEGEIINRSYGYCNNSEVYHNEIKPKIGDEPEQLNFNNDFGCIEFESWSHDECCGFGGNGHRADCRKAVK